MALINRPMYEHFAARHLAVKGPGALTQIEEGVMGTLPLDMMSDPVYWFIQGIRIFSNSVNQAAVAGQYAMVGLSIETDSEDVLARIISIEIESFPCRIKRCARTAFSSDPGIRGAATDTRTPEAQESQAIILNGNSAAPPGAILNIYDAPGAPRSFQDTEIPLIVSPEQVIYVQHASLNTAMRVGITWAEIPAYKAEL